MMNSFQLTAWLQQLIIFIMMVQSAISVGGRTGAVVGGPPPAFTTWFVQNNGGTRSTATGYAFGQCDGKSTAAYPGTTNAVWQPAHSYTLGTVITDNGGHYETVATAGVSTNTIPPAWGPSTNDNTVVWTRGGLYPVNQSCAFGDPRWLYDAQDGTTRHWVIAGGDTVKVSGGPYRIGHDQGIQNLDVWCNNGTDNNQTCYIPQPPAGNAINHTIIESVNCIVSCSDTSGYGPDVSQLVVLHGGYGLFHILDLNTTNYVDFKGFDLTRWSDCAQHGFPILPTTCSANGSFPASDYVIDGVATFTGLQNFTIQDVWIHGFTNRGVIGPIGGSITAERVRISYNGMGGWDFDDGAGDPSINNPTFNLLDSVIEWSGCNQEFPYTHQYPVASCSDQNNAGYGDGVGVPGGPLNVNVVHTISRYNTQDGMDYGHVDVGSSTMNISNSIFYGNMGSPYKWGFNFSTMRVVNNLSLDNCTRMLKAIPGAPASYNTNLSLFCRAGAGFSFNFRAGQAAVVGNNIFVGYSPTRNTIGCSTSVSVGGCTSATMSWHNNVYLGYDNPFAYPYGGAAGGPALFYCQDNTLPGPPQVSCDTGFVTWSRSNNNYFGNRASTCPTGYANETCTTNTNLTNQPTGNAGSFLEAELDLPVDGGTFSFVPALGSALINGGISYTGIPTTDQAGIATTSPPVIGGLNH